MIWWISAHLLPNILVMALYFKHLHHPTTHEARCFGIPKFQGADKALKIYEPGSEVLLAIALNTPPKKRKYISEQHPGKIFACCTLHGTKSPAKDFLSESYNHVHPLMLVMCPHVLTLKDFW